MFIEKDFRFDSAHFLPNVPDEHKCKRMHGHTYWATFCIEGEIDENGWVVDFGDLTKIIEPVIKTIDHTLLNAVPGLENPTVENIAKFLYEKLSKKIPNLKHVLVKETPFSRCRYPN